MFIVKFRLPLPLLRKRVTAARRTNNFRKKLYLHIREYGNIVWNSWVVFVCDLKTHVESFQVWIAFYFCAHTHSLAACYASRPFLLPTFVRCENCEAFRACVSCARAYVCVCVCGRVCMRRSCNKKKHKIKWQRQKCFIKIYMSIICNRQKMICNEVLRVCVAVCVQGTKTDR